MGITFWIRGRLPKSNTTVEKTRTHRTKYRDGFGSFWGERYQEWDWKCNPRYSLWRTLGFFEKSREQTMEKLERLMVKSEATLARLLDFRAKQQAN
jgi:hypothetical protein